MKLKHKVEQSVSIRIAVLLLILGILSLIFSIYALSQVLALIGLGLIFWGVLFLLLKPVNFVKGSFLYNAAVSEYLTIERIFNEFKWKGNGYYIPPYPKDVYIPEYLRGLKDAVVFFSAEKDSTMPSIEEMAKGKFITKNPKGILLTPPGTGIVTQIEEKSKVEITKMTLDEVTEVLPRIIIQDLNLAKSIAMEQSGDQVHVKIADSLYKDLYGMRNSLKSVDVLGCPIASSVACALAKASGRSVTIQKYQFSPDGMVVDVWYRIVKV